jgi:hypothetical protein
MGDGQKKKTKRQFIPSFVKRFVPFAPRSDGLSKRRVNTE